MKIYRHKPFHFLRIPVYVILICIFFLLSACNDLFVIHGTPEIKNGTLNLTNFNIKKHKPIALIGEVEFYWRKLLTPTDFDSSNLQVPDGLITIPGVWNGYIIKGQTLDSDGYATFRFKINVREDGVYGLKINEMDCAYKIWVNGIVDSVGKVAATKKDMIPAWNRKEIYFSSKNSKIQVIIQMSNFQHRKGGPEDPVLFGTASGIAQRKEFMVAENMFILSVLVLMGLLNILIFSQRHSEKSLLLFSLLCFGMALRLLTTSEKLILDIFPHLFWNFTVSLEYFSFTICVPLTVHFMYSYYPKDFSIKIIKVSYLIAAIFCIGYFFTPVKFYSHTPIYYQIIIFFTGIYIMVSLIHAYLNKRDNSIIFLSSYVFFFVIVVNDILYYNKLINTSFLMPLGITVMIFSQSFALKKRLIKAFSDIETLTEKLNRHRHTLEKIIDDRTQRIQRQKEKIEIQAETMKEINDELRDLSRFKDNMTGMAVHDMKNHLNNIMILAERKLIGLDGFSDSNEAIGYSARQLLILVMNILDIQRFEESRKGLDCKEISLRNTVNKAIKDLTVMSRQKKTGVQNFCMSEVYVKADVAIIERVFINLISNAIKYSPLNTVIEVRCEREGDFVKFMVIDQGVGVPEVLRKKIFNKFEKIDHSVSGDSKSTGLGLTFCKLAVEAHGGEIGIESNNSQGSVFWFTLPLAENQPDIKPENQVHEMSFKDLNLSIVEKGLLIPYCQKFSTIKHYEISTINAVLSNIRTELKYSITPAIEVWLDTIKKASVHGDEELYEAKIKEILQAQDS